MYQLCHALFWRGTTPHVGKFQRMFQVPEREGLQFHGDELAPTKDEDVPGRATDVMEGS